MELPVTDKRKTVGRAGFRGRAGVQLCMDIELEMRRHLHRDDDVYLWVGCDN